MGVRSDDSRRRHGRGLGVRCWHRRTEAEPANLRCERRRKGPGAEGVLVVRKGRAPEEPVPKQTGRARVAAG